MKAVSSTQGIPEASAVPRHIAVIMDGNGRWARQRGLPRFAGHKKGVDAVREMVQNCLQQGVQCLTIFAFSSENWRRPPEEVSLLMMLFVATLEREVKRFHANGIRFRVAGDVSRFDQKLRDAIVRAEQKTQTNTRLTFTICANYGGRWDIMQAVNKMIALQPGKTDFSEQDLKPHLSLSDLPEPDLFIRTGGEQRISNFLLWQLAYTELYFTDTYWPDFDAKALDAAIASYQTRERRFGRTSEQVAAG